MIWPWKFLTKSRPLNSGRFLITHKPNNHGKKAIEFLWGLLDEIDTASDIAKGDSRLYQHLVNEQLRKRWTIGITTNGHKLDLTHMDVPEPEKKDGDTMRYNVM